MPQTVMQARFEDYAAAALEDDLETDSRLDAAQRLAVRIAGLTVLPLAPDRLEREFAALFRRDGAPAPAGDGPVDDALLEAARAETLLAEDTIVQMAAYIGFPRARQALACLAGAGADVRAAPDPNEGRSRDPSPEARYRRGLADYRRLNPEAFANIQDAFGDLAGRVVERTFRAFGDVYARSGQPLVLRQCATIAGLGTLGCAAPQLRFHISAGLNVGLTRQQIVEIVAWIQFLAGAPAAYNALTELKAALAAGAAATPGYR